MKNHTVTRIAIASVAIFVLLVQTVSASGAAAAAGGPKPAQKWTFMVYIAGDNNLEPYVTTDIEDELGYSNDDINVVVLADRTPGYDDAAGDWTQTLLFYVTPGMTATPENALEDWGERNTGDPQTLIDFVQWTKANYPAERYALIFWDHGWGWRPYQAIWDETDDDTLDQHEIATAMDTLGPIDLVGYDACEMQMIEVHATWRPYAQAFVGSQEDEWYDGMEFEIALPALQANPDMTAEQLAVELSQSMSEWTASSVALNADWDSLLTAVDEWSVALLDGLPTYKSEYDAAYRHVMGVKDPLNKDLYDAAYEVMTHASDPTIQAKSQAVMNAVEAVVLHEWHKPKYGDAHGIGIFWPRRVVDLDEPSSPQWNDFQYYQDYLAFSQLTHWDEFLDAYVNGQ